MAQNGSYAFQLLDEIAALKAKIDKMKNCENCRHFKFVEAYQQKECHGQGCVNKDKWER